MRRQNRLIKVLPVFSTCFPKNFQKTALQNKLKKFFSAYCHSSHEKNSENKTHFLKTLLQTPVGTKRTNRGLMIVPPLMVHLSIGSIYSWSLYNGALTSCLGVVSSSVADWSFSTVVPVFSTITAFHGLSAWLLSNWQVKVGPRHSLLIGALSFGGGMMVAGLGARLHALSLLYLGYGVMGGIGLGLCYVPPMANLIRWFPEKVGFASGATICGFGGGALLAAPIIQKLLRSAFVPPTFVGGIGVLSDGRIMAADTDGVMREVVQLTYSIIADTELLPGLYQVGSGSSGAALTLVTMGALYLTAIASAAFMVKKPPLNFSGPISKNNINNVRVASNQTSYLSIISPLTYFSSVKTNIELTIQRLLPPKTFLGHKDADADISAVMRCRQFYLLWATFSPLVMVGMALAGTAKDMILEVFGSALPAVVTPSFAVGYVAAFSLFNLGGRLFWASFSDKYGQQNAFRVFSGLGFPLALILPLSVLALAHFTSIEFREGHSFAEMLAKFAMWTFLASSLAIVSIFGGACSTVPAFAAELFGRNVIDKVHGRLLTAAAFAGLCGPILVSQLRARAERRAVATILPAVDDQKFFDRFGVTKKETHALMKSNAITIKKVLEIAPDGTVDPSPTLYNSTLYVISAMFVVAGLTSRAICKVPASVFKVSKKDN